MFGTLDNAPINKNKPISDAILMPKVALPILSLIVSLKTMIDISAHHRHVSVFSSHRMSYSFLVQSKPQCSRKRLPKFHFTLIPYQP
jgi:hypothetical protein